MNRYEISTYLFQHLDMVEPYPPGVAKIYKQCDFTAFFPGGKGIWEEVESNKIPYIMVLGHDFSTEKKFNEMLAGKENDIDSPTWRNMIKLFNSSGIDLEECFFTNVFMGLRKTESMVGEFPGFKDKEFLARSIDFLKLQIDVLKPKVVITLGKYAAELLTNATSDLDVWKNQKALKTADIGLIRGVRFSNHISNCAALEHPSMRNSNVKRREYKGLKGNEAEITLLADSLK